MLSSYLEGAVAFLFTRCLPRGSLYVQRGSAGWLPATWLLDRETVGTREALMTMFGVTHINQL